jgi:hypothetical protein
VREPKLTPFIVGTGTNKSLSPTNPGPIIALIGIAIAVVGWWHRKS